MYLSIHRSRHVSTRHFKPSVDERDVSLNVNVREKGLSRRLRLSLTRHSLVVLSVSIL